MGVFDHDVWLNTGDHDRLRRVAESLARSGGAFGGPLPDLGSF
jgi:hypothetical protein